MSTISSSTLPETMEASISESPPKKAKRYALVFHGGAGSVARDVDPSVYHKALSSILKEAKTLCETALTGAISVVDVVDAVVCLLEDNPLFNAGKGAVFTSESRHELEASIMDGSSMQCGSVVCVTHVKNPISLAHDVMVATPHVLIGGRGVELFAKGKIVGVTPSKKHTIVDNSFFSTAARKKTLERKKRETERRAKIVYDGMEISPLSSSSDLTAKDIGETVGCVAMVNGHVAAATSTGGRTNKMPGRIGDTPIIGAGNYACDETCAVSGTGKGEVFQRMCTAFDVHSRMKYAGATVQKACDDHLSESFSPGTGGIIAVDAAGDFGIVRNTPSMSRGLLDSDGVAHVAIWDETVDVHL